jgi:hypothetical protein
MIERRAHVIRLKPFSLPPHHAAQLEGYNHDIPTINSQDTFYSKFIFAT